MTVAVGFFDGVHRGHQEILKGADVALTFINHPLSVLAPERAPKLLMGFDERYHAIKECGVKKVEALDFTSELAAMSPVEFVARYFSRPAADREQIVIRCGANWRFGKAGAGTPKLLDEMQFKVVVVPYVEYAGEPISSSRIRAAVAAGDLELARAMLGRDLAFVGVPSVGKGVGSQLGYPTLNLNTNANLPRGVYSAIVNYGCAPTMGERAWPAPVMEVHLHQYLREERKFDTLKELQSQIANDIETAFAKGTAK